MQFRRTTVILPPACHVFHSAGGSTLSHTHRKPFVQRVRYLLLLGILAKLLVDTAAQIYYPYLGVIAAGTGVTIVAMGRLVSLRNLTGLSAPILGNIGDRIGYRYVIQLSLFLSGAGMLVIAVSRSVFMFAVGIVLTGIGQAGYTPSIHAFLSSKLPYAKRATGLGMIEYAWALAGILGLSIAGRLIDAFSWRSPFMILGFAFICMSLWYFTVPIDVSGDTKVAGATNVAKDRSDAKASIFARFIRFFDLGKRKISSWACIAVSGLNMFAMMHIIIIHGRWLQAEYGLTPTALGTVAFVFGLVDLTASLLVSTLVDRIGKRRSVLIGVIGFGCGALLLPFLNRGVVLAIMSIAIPRFFFEFAIVSNFPLLSEQAPESRGKVLSLGITAGLLGSTLAAITGPKAYLAAGVVGLGPVSFAAAAVAALLLIFLVRERTT